MKWNPFSKKGPQNMTLKDGQSFTEAFNTRGKTQSGATVNDSTALCQSAVYACVRTLSQSVAGLPLKVYETDGVTRKAVDHPLNRLLGVSPNGEQTAFELREFQMTCLGLRGNAYAQKRLDGRGRVGEINPLNAAYMNVDRDQSGKLVFDYQETGSARTFTDSEIWRIASLGTDGVTGLSPIALARETIGTSIATQGHGASTFKNGVNPSIVLGMEGALDDKAFERLREQLENGSAGYGNAGKPFIAEHGMKPYAISMSNRDAQFLESRKFEAEEIARWYGVPPHMIGILDRATFSNIEQQSLDFVINTLLPWLRRIEATMARDLLTPAEQGRLFFSHSVEGMLRGDIKSRYEAYGIAVDRGFMNRNEVRSLENRSQVDGLDQFTLPVNIETLSEREKRFERTIASNLADSEINALRSERNKGGEDLGDRVVDFYSRFTKRLIDTGVSEQDAQNYTINRCEQFENKMFDKIERNAQLDIAEIL